MELYRRFFLGLWITLCGGMVWAEAGAAESRAREADKAFQTEHYTEALDLYDGLYAEGQYSEAMLYRMAYMQEQMKVYPLAIFYLKKAAKEFGNPAIDAKVKQLMQLQGSDRFFPSSGWNTYLHFFRQWGWLIWGLFGISVLAIVAHLFLPFQRDYVWRKGIAAGAWTLTILLAAVLFHRSFWVPKLAVVTGQTAFYDAPGYASKVTPRAFSMGETVSILDDQDIWLLVEAGDKAYWVPRNVVREL